MYRYGRFIRLTPERLDKAERWLKQHGSRAVFLGRLVPGSAHRHRRRLRRVRGAVHACSFPAMSLGALLYILVYTLLGYFLGQPVLDRAGEDAHPVRLARLAGAAVADPAGGPYRARQGLGQRATTPFAADREQQLRAGAVAGGLATIASTLLFNVVINLAGNIAFNAPGTLVEQTAARLAFAVRARGSAGVAVRGACPRSSAVGVLWGALYAVVARSDACPPRWPDWLKGLASPCVPLLVSLALVMPLLGLGVLRRRRDRRRWRSRAS